MENFIIRSELENIIGKVNNLIRQEELQLDSLKTIFVNLSYFYKTKNTLKITNVNNDMNKNLKAISNNCYNSVVVLKKNIDKYVQTEAEVATLFNNITKE